MRTYHFRSVWQQPLGPFPSEPLSCARVTVPYCLQLLRREGIGFPAIHVTDPTQLPTILETLPKGSFVVKAATDAKQKIKKGMVVFARSREEVTKAVEDIRAAMESHEPGSSSAGVFIQPRVREGTEVLVSARNTEYGPYVMVKLGGELAEKKTPIAVSLGGCRSLVTQLDNTGIPARFHNQIIAIAEGMVRVLEAYPQIGTIEINPVICSNGKAVPVDLRITHRAEQIERPHVMSQEKFNAQMDGMLNPGFVVLAGPSTDPRNMVRWKATMNIAESQDINGRRLAFISPTNGESVTVTLTNGRTNTYPCYRTLAELVTKTGRKPDVVVAPLPPEPTIELAEACSAFEVPIVMIGSGFSEVKGPEAEEHTRQLAAVFAKGRIIGIGPNTYGIHTTYPNYWNLTFDIFGAMDEIGLPRHGGKIAIITQSGGVCAGVCGSLTNLWVQIDFALAIGNSMGLDIDQLAAYVAARDKTTISFYYLEKNPGRLFVDLIAATTPRKPVVVFKGARHDENTAAATHTGSISSDNDVLACALENAGAIVVQDEIIASLLLGMLENGMATRLAEKIRTARAEGRPEPGVLIVTQSGADGVLTMDHTLDRKASFRLAKPASKHVAEIQALIGPTISIQPNPVDTGPTGNMERICQILTADQDVGLTLLAIRRPFAPSLIPDREKTGDDVVLVFPNSGSRRVFVHAVDEKHWIVSNDPQKVLDAFAHVYHYARFLADKSP